MDRLPAEILHEIISPQPVETLQALRIVGNHLVTAIATEILFSSVLLKHTPSSAAKFLCILSEPAKSSYVRVFSFDSGAPHEEAEDELELDPAVRGALLRLSELPNVHTLHVIFSGEWYAARNRWKHDYSSAQVPKVFEGREDVEFRDAVFESVLQHPLPKLSALRIDNVQYFDSLPLAKPSHWNLVLGRLKSLELHVTCDEAAYLSGELDLSDIQLYYDDLAPIWLRPCAQTLTSLTLGGDGDIWWGTFPEFKHEDFPKIPNLEHLELVRFGFGRDEQFEWLFGLADTLRSLKLRECVIIYCAIDEDINQVTYWKSWAWVWEQILLRGLEKFAFVFKYVEYSEEDESDLETGWTMRYMSYNHFEDYSFHYYIEDMDGAGSGAPNYPRFLELEEMDRAAFERLADRFDGCQREDARAMDRRMLRKLMKHMDPGIKEYIDSEYEELEAGDEDDVGVPVVEFYEKDSYDPEFIWERDDRDYRGLFRELRELAYGPWWTL